MKIISIWLYTLEWFQVLIICKLSCFPVTILIDNDNNGGASGVMVIVVGNGHGDTSSNPGRD